VFIVVADLLLSDGSTASHQSSTSRQSRIVVDGHDSPVSGVVVMATRTCQPLLRHRGAGQLAAGARRRRTRTG